MPDRKFQTNEVFHFAWGTTRLHIGFLLSVLILGYVVMSAPNFFAEYFQKTAPILSFLLGLGAVFLNFLIQLGWTRISLRLCDQQKPAMEDLFAHSHLVLRYLGASILCGLAILGGFVLLIVPGVILMVRFGFYTYLILDKNLGALDSLKTSWTMTRGQTGTLFVFGLAILGVNILGLACLLVGLLWTVPLTMLATAYVYRKFVPMENAIAV